MAAPRLPQLPPRTLPLLPPPLATFRFSSTQFPLWDLLTLLAWDWGCSTFIRRTFFYLFFCVTLYICAPLQVSQVGEHNSPPHRLARACQGHSTQQHPH